VIVEPTRDRRAERREATRAEILEAAWELSRTQGLAGLSLRDVARKIGMQPPSLYWYFDSKQAIYDAMFAQGNRQLLERLTGQHWPGDPRSILRLTARVFVEFSAEDVERYQLLFQRTIPDFQPSPESYALAVQVFDQIGKCHAIIPAPQRGPNRLGFRASGSWWIRDSGSPRRRHTTSGCSTNWQRLPG